jgi:hypothetical protein
MPTHGCYSSAPPLYRTHVIDLVCTVHTSRSDHRQRSNWWLQQQTLAHTPFLSRWRTYRGACRSLCGTGGCPRQISIAFHVRSAFFVSSIMLFLTRLSTLHIHFLYAGSAGTPSHSSNTFSVAGISHGQQDHLRLVPPTSTVRYRLSLERMDRKLRTVDRTAIGPDSVIGSTIIPRPCSRRLDGFLPFHVRYTRRRQRECYYPRQIYRSLQLLVTSRVPHHQQRQVRAPEIRGHERLIPELHLLLQCRSTGLLHRSS